MKLFFAFTALLAATAAEEPTTCDEAQDFIHRAYAGEEDEALAALSEEHGDEWDYIRNVCAELCTAEDKGDCDEFFDGRYEEEFGEDAMPSCAEVESWIDGVKAGAPKETADLEEMIREEGEDDAWEMVEDYCDAACGYSNCGAMASCARAQIDLTDSTNAVEKVGLKVSCEAACANVDGETCGYLVNGLSFALFAILAIFKY